MRALLGLLLAVLVMGGCSTESDRAEPGTTTASVAPEDTLEVLGAWEGPDLVATDEPLILTLSDDNTYVIADSCVELPGRWELRGGRVLLTPNPQENVRCSENRTWPTLVETYEVEDDRLVPVGEGSGFTRLSD